MATDPGTATPGTIKKKLYYGVAIDLGSTRTGIVVVRGDVADYFNISIDQAATGGMIQRTRKAYTRPKYSQGLDGSADSTLISVSRSEWFEAPKARGNKATGRRIIVPTELKSPKGFRTVVMHFPGAAINSVISAWLYEKCTAHRPTSFKTETGQRILVVSKGSISDLNPGNKKPDAAAG